MEFEPVGTEPIVGDFVYDTGENYDGKPAEVLAMTESAAMVKNWHKPGLSDWFQLNFFGSEYGDHGYFNRVLRRPETDTTLHKTMMLKELADKVNWALKVYGDIPVVIGMGVFGTGGADYCDSVEGAEIVKGSRFMDSNVLGVSKGTTVFNIELNTGDEP